MEVTQKEMETLAIYELRTRSQGNFTILLKGITSRLGNAQKVLEASSSHLDMVRAQGKVQAYRELLTLFTEDSEVYNRVKIKFAAKGNSDPHRGTPV